MNKPTYLQGILDAEAQYNYDYCKRKLQSWFEEECKATLSDYRWSD